MTEKTDIAALRRRSNNLRTADQTDAFIDLLLDKLESERQQREAAEKERERIDRRNAELNSTLERWSVERAESENEIEELRATLRGEQEPVGNEFLPNNLDRALMVMGMALPESKEEFNFHAERWMQRLIDRVIRFGDEIQTAEGAKEPDHYRYSCGSCGYESLAYTSKCPTCNYHKIEEEALFTRQPKHVVVLPDGYKPCVQRGGQQSTNYRAMMTFGGEWLHRDAVVETLAAAGIVVKDGE